MALINNINISSPNDGLGDALRDAMEITNDNFAALNSDKVEAVAGKGLSQNDFTDAEQTKLSGVETGAQVNVQADWLQDNALADDYIKNKPNDGNLQVSGIYTFVYPDFTVKAGWVWQINNVYYTNPVDVVIPIAYCGAGLVRKDIIYFNEANTAVTITGLEVASGPVIPTLPANSVLLTVIDVTDGTITIPEQSVTDELADHNKLYWDASTNTPNLADVTGRIGNYYTVSVAGTVNFGSGNITFGVGDEVKHNSAIWYKSVDNNQSSNTNLSNVPAPTEISINSSTGSGTSLPLADGVNAGLFSPAEKTTLSNQSGTNTGDEDNASIKSKLGQAGASSDGWLSSTDWNTFDAASTPYALDVADGTGSSLFSVLAAEKLRFSEFLVDVGLKKISIPEIFLAAKKFLTNLYVWEADSTTSKNNLELRTSASNIASSNPRFYEIAAHGRDFGAGWSGAIRFICNESGVGDSIVMEIDKDKVKVLKDLQVVGGFGQTRLLLQDRTSDSIVSMIGYPNSLSGVWLVDSFKVGAVVGIEDRTQGSLGAGGWTAVRRFFIQSATYSEVNAFQIQMDGTGVVTIDANALFKPDSLDLSALGSYADDTAAGVGGVNIGEGYINSSTGALHRRLT